MICTQTYQFFHQSLTVLLQLNCGWRCFNTFNARIISNNNRKRMTKFAAYFAELLQKKLLLKPSKVAIFQYNNTGLIFKEFLMAT